MVGLCLYAFRTPGGTGSVQAVYRQRIERWYVKTFFIEKFSLSVRNAKIQQKHQLLIHLTEVKAGFNKSGTEKPLYLTLDNCMNINTNVE